MARTPVPESDRPHVVVIGAGIIGLTTALTLLDAGYAVTVCAKAIVGSTVVSQVMAGWWIADDEYTTHTKDRAWAKHTFNTLLEQSRSTPEAGLRLLRGYRLLQKESQAELPWFKEFIPSLRGLTDTELQEFQRTHGGVVAGWTMEDVMMNPSVYLSWLRAQLFNRGGVLLKREFRMIEEAAREFNDCVAVVNCAGLGARELVGDASLYPVQGQTVLVHAPEIDYWLSIGGKPEAGGEVGPGGETSRLDGKQNVTYLFPVGDGTVLLGGTKRFTDVDVSSLSFVPDPDVTREIVKGCATVEPVCASARVIRAQVGYRPFRAGGQIRLERETPSGERRVGCVVIHNYGHSDCGMGVSWGCALEVRDLLRLARQQVSKL